MITPSSPEAIEQATHVPDVTALVGILETRRDGADETLPDEPFIEVAKRLIELRAPEAIEVLLDLYLTLDLDLVLYNEIALGLHEYGEMLLEPMLARCGEGSDYEDVWRAAFVLVELGIWDDRIKEILYEILEEEPEIGMCNLGVYGDPSTLDNVLAIAQAIPTDGSEQSIRLAVESEETLCSLEYDIPAELQQHLDLCKGLQRPIRVQPKPGRNDPCHCGSGKKYKRCCGA